MPISTLCACGAALEAPDELAGQSIKCPQCAAVLAIPGAAKEASAPATAEHAPSGTAPAGDRPSELPPERPQETTRAEDCLGYDDVPAEIRAKALEELDPSEKLVWLGQPNRKLVLLRNLGYLAGGMVAVAIALLWLGVSLTPKPAVAARPGVPARPATPGHFDILPAIILVIGGGCVAVALFRLYQAKGTCYALTRRRALVYKPGLFGPTKESYSPAEVSAMRRSNSWVLSEGGDVIFRSVTVVTTSRSSSGKSSSTARTYHYGFLAVPQVHQVEKLVRETLVDRFVDKLTQANAL